MDVYSTTGLINAQNTYFITWAPVPDAKKDKMMSPPWIQAKLGKHVSKRIVDCRESGRGGWPAVR